MTNLINTKKALENIFQIAFTADTYADYTCFNSIDQVSPGRYLCVDFLEADSYEQNFDLNTFFVSVLDTNAETIDCSKY